jgi:hypothetical protein
MHLDLNSVVNEKSDGLGEKSGLVSTLEAQAETF